MKEKYISEDAGESGNASFLFVLVTHLFQSLQQMADRRGALSVEKRMRGQRRFHRKATPIKYC